MDHRLRSAPGRLRRLVTFGATALLLGLAGSSARAQETVKAPASPQGLDELLTIGLERQPALAAARASLASAESGRRGLDSLPIFARVLARDLPVRKEQACLGINIAGAGLRQAEWETRYAVTRNFYSIQYARLQDGVIVNLQKKLEQALKKAIDLRDLGDPKIKVTQIDVDILALNVEFVKAKRTETTNGILRAAAALREALGVGLDYPLQIVAAPLPELEGTLNKDELVAMALANRGELDQASAALRVTELEVFAQGRVCCKPVVMTFASGSDLHAKEIPQGFNNGNYSPGAIGLEMPVNLVGSRIERMQRAQDLSVRAGAVVDKTQNLIALEVENYYLKWQEAAEKVRILKATPKLSLGIITKVEKNFNEGSASAEELLRARAQEDQTQAQLNEARYLQVLALAALERATAGVFRMPTAAVKK